MRRLVSCARCFSAAGGGKCRPRLALDVGCGSGQNTLALARCCEAVVGVDASEAQVEAARRAGRDVPNLTFRAALGHELSFQPVGNPGQEFIQSIITYHESFLFCSTSSHIPYIPQISF